MGSQALAEKLPLTEASPIDTALDRTSARRKLVLGAAAILPSIVTVSSGAQTALASNMRCWSKDPAEGPPDRFSYLPDGWLRKQVFKGEHRGAPAFNLAWDQASGLDPGNPNKAAVGSVWLVNDQKVTAEKGEVINGISNGVQAYALVYTDSTGSMVTLDPESAPNLRPVREACWTSMLGNRRVDICRLTLDLRRRTLAHGVRCNR